MACPDKLHIPHKKWAVAGNVDNGTLEEQNLLRIERWANSLPCSEGGLPRAWCANDSDTLGQNDTLLVTATVPTEVTNVVCHVTIIVQNVNGGDLTVDVAGYFYSDQTLNNDGYAYRDSGFTWPDNARRTIAATCAFSAGDEIGVEIINLSAGDVVVNVSVTVIEVDSTSATCCTAGG